MIFAYERSLRGTPSPVVYHDRKAPSRTERPIIAQFDITDRPDLIDVDGSPNFGRLQAVFPPPAPVTP